MRRYLHPFLLVFAFLFAQVGYTAHLATHLVAPSGPDQGHLADKPCDLCVSYAQLGGGPLAPAIAPPPVVAAVQDWVVADHAVFTPVFSLYARARAPPAVLV